MSAADLSVPGDALCQEYTAISRPGISGGMGELLCCRTSVCCVQEKTRSYTETAGSLRESPCGRRNLVCYSRMIFRMKGGRETGASLNSKQLCS